MNSKSALYTQKSKLENPNLALSSTSEADACHEMERDIIMERLRQARLSFNIALLLTTVSTMISLVGIGLLFSGKVSEGTVTTAGGLTSEIVSVRFLKLTKEANDRLDRMAKDLKEED